MWLWMGEESVLFETLEHFQRIQDFVVLLDFLIQLELNFTPKWRISGLVELLHFASHARMVTFVTAQ